jgi:two-component system, OmpR family, response regulator ResD
MDDEVGGQWLTAGPVKLHLGLNQVAIEHRHVALRRREAELLEFFMRHAGETFDRHQILKAVWGYDLGDASTVTVHIRRLRQKIEVDPSEPRLLVTVWGVGYCLATPKAE